MIESFVLAVVGSPFGVRGFVRVRSFSGETSHLASLKEVILRHKGTEKIVIIEETSVPDKGSWVLMKFAGVDSPEAAGAFTGAELVADRAHAAPLGQGEFYVEELKGLSVVFAAPLGEEVLGRVVDIIEGGGGSLAEIQLLSGETRLVPFRDEFFGDINIAAGWAELREKWILEL